MKTRCVVIWLAAVSGFGQTPADLPGRDRIHSLMRTVNAAQLRNPVMKDGDRNWERGTWYTGVMAAWKSTGDREFFDQAMAWGKKHDWQVGTEVCGGNRLFSVQTWLELYFKRKDAAMIRPAIEWLRTPAPNSPAGTKRWYLERTYSYVDSLYGASALAMLAKATGDKQYLEIMDAFFDDVTGELFDSEAGLYYRDHRYIGKTTGAGRKILWSRGNGWVFAGIARVLEYLPRGDRRRERYLKIYQRMAPELVKRQGADGLWRPNLDDPEHVAMPETSGTGFFCYGLAWGINRGILDRATYLPAVQRAWAALESNVSPEGRVLWGQQVDGQPNPLKRESSHEYVTGAFLLAGSEVWKLVGK